MTRAPLDFQRIVLGLHAGAPTRTATLAAQFAALFDLELLGVQPFDEESESFRTNFITETVRLSLALDERTIECGV